MTDLRADLAELITALSPGDGFHDLPVPGAHCVHVSRPSPPSKLHWRPSMSIIVQGGKGITLGRDAYHYSAGHTIATLIDLPVVSHVATATSAIPFLGLQIDLDPLTLGEVVAQMNPGSQENGDVPARAVFLGNATAPMLEAAIRLVKLCITPEDAPVLGPLVTRELVYHLLKSADGQALRQFVHAGNSTHKIAQAIYSLRAELDQEIEVGSLAKAAAMSRSAFFKHFKEVTAMSPIQYQKRLRLLEARRLMFERGETAEGAAFQVGYSSASQFSREYSRMFGNAPLRDAVKIKAFGELVPQV